VGIAGYAFDVVQDQLTQDLTEMPLGFRVWRAVTTILHGRAATDSRFLAALPSWVKMQLRDAERLRRDSLFPGRSLDLESAMAVPDGWSPPGDDWVHEVLLARATNGEAVIRERGTAIHGLWERALRYDHPDLDRLEEQLRKLIADYLAEAKSLGDTSLGLEWVGATMQAVLDRHEPVCNIWPDTEFGCLDAVRAGTDEFSRLPLRIQSAAKTLLEHAMLQNAGVHRRHAVDSLLAGGWSDEATKAYKVILNHPKADAWLRCRALFGFGMLQHRKQRGHRHSDGDVRPRPERSPNTADKPRSGL